MSRLKELKAIFEEHVSYGVVDLTMTNKNTAYILGWRLFDKSKSEYFAFGDKDDMGSLIKSNSKYHDISLKEALETFDIAINRNQEGLVFTTSL